jgi:hypothetical protein
LSAASPAHRERDAKTAPESSDDFRWAVKPLALHSVAAFSNNEVEPDFAMTQQSARPSDGIESSGHVDREKSRRELIRSNEEIE